MAMIGLRFSLNICFKTISIGEMDQGFSKKERLLKRKEFQLVFDNGERFGNNQLKIYALSNGNSVSRLGLVVGRKFGNSPRRNRFKRILREAYRLNKSLLNNGADIVVIPRSGLTELTLNTIEDKFKIILIQINDKLKK
jgi:ribonuclease P protein component